MFFNKLTSCLLAGALLLLGALPLATAMAIEYSVAEYNGPEQCIREANLIGVKHCVTYARVGETDRLSYAETPGDWDATLVVKFPEVRGGTVHEAIKRGDFDDDLVALFALAREEGRPITGRIMPEGNGWWNPDAAYRPGQSPETYVDTYNYVAKLMRWELGPLLRDLEFNLNFRSFGYDRTGLGVSDFERFAGVTENSTLVTFSGYNRCGIDPVFDTIRTFDDIFAPAISETRDIFTGQPLGIAEIGSSPYCGVDLLAWYTDALQKAKAAEMVRVGLFFNPDPDIGETDRPERWDAVLECCADQLRDVIANTQASTTEGNLLPSLRPADDIRQREVQQYATPRKWKTQLEGWANFRMTFMDEPIPGFGTQGLVGQGTLRLSRTTEFNNRFGEFEVGPSALVGAVISDQCNDRYWQCQARVEVGPVIKFDFGRGEDYRSLRVGPVAGYRYYPDVGSRPDYLDKGDGYVGVDATYVFGVTWD